MKNKKPASVSVTDIREDRIFGSVAQRLTANGMRASALRTNDTLRHEEWIDLDKAVVDIARIRLVGINDLVSAGLTYTVTNGLGKTVIQYEDMSDMSAANISMDGVTPGQRDRVVFDIKSLPLPIVHKDFAINSRVLAASRTLGDPLDTTQVQIATRKVAEYTEDMLFNGASAYTFGGGTLRGYTDHPNRNTVTLSQNWDASGKTGAEILVDVLAMKQASITAKHFGPWILYIPTAYESTLDDDFKANSDVTIRQRILQIASIKDIKVADQLTANNVVLVEMNPETVRVVIGLQPTAVEWETEGGMLHNFKVMSILVPQIRADQDGNSGIVHLSA